MSLFRLCYYSENHLDGRGAARLSSVREIIKSSERRNSAVGVTGALVVSSLWFVQFLEGSRDAVSATYNRLLDDPRHAGLTIVSAGPVQERTFQTWWMGLLRLDGLDIGPFDPRLCDEKELLRIALLLMSGLASRQRSA